jgi:hypothetical protein
MPVFGSHQLLWVSFSPDTTVVTRVGSRGFVTSQISCADPSGPLEFRVRRR